MSSPVRTLAIIYFWSNNWPTDRESDCQIMKITGILSVEFYLFPNRIKQYIHFHGLLEFKIDSLPEIAIQFVFKTTTFY